MNTTSGHRLFWLVPTLALAIVPLVLFLTARFYPIAQSAPLEVKTTSLNRRHVSALSPSRAARASALQGSMARRQPSRGLSPSNAAPPPPHGPRVGDENDDEIALFDNNLLRLKHGEDLLKSEKTQGLFDEQTTERLHAELVEMSNRLPFSARVHVLCTSSICEVQWQSAEDLETLIPELAPWLATQANYSVAESAEPFGRDFDVRRALRLLLPNDPSRPTKD